MEIVRIGVVGAGAMGSGIAHVAAQSGFQVILRDVTDAALDKALGRMRALDERSIAKGRLTAEEAAAAMGRIEKTTAMDRFAEADLVVEAVFEDFQAKQDVFTQLDRICRPEVIIASNTSSMSITELANSTGRPQQVAGMHFFNPVQVMKLVEVIRGYHTSDATIATCREIAHRLGKETVEVKKDSPGFIVNRILMPMFAEAMLLLEEGAATPEEIDKAVRLGLNHPMGPLTLADFTGLDVDLNVMEYFYREFQNPKYAPPQILKRLVRAGRLGNKTGAGFHDHPR